MIASRAQVCKSSSCVHPLKQHHKASVAAACDGSDLRLKTHTTNQRTAHQWVVQHREVRPTATTWQLPPLYKSGTGYVQLKKRVALVPTHTALPQSSKSSNCHALGAHRQQPLRDDAMQHPTPVKAHVCLSTDEPAAHSVHTAPTNNRHRRSHAAT